MTCATLCSLLILKKIWRKKIGRSRFLSNMVLATVHSNESLFLAMYCRQMSYANCQLGEPCDIPTTNCILTYLFLPLQHSWCLHECTKPHDDCDMCHTNSQCQVPQCTFSLALGYHGQPLLHSSLWRNFLLRFQQHSNSRAYYTLPSIKKYFVLCTP